MITDKIPSFWKKLPSIEYPPGNIGAYVFEHRLVPLRVLRSISETKDGEFWIHLSVSRPDRLPSWDELKKVKNEFLGEDVEAYQVLPKKKDYVNAHPHCLHLWVPRDERSRVANLQELKWENGV